MPTPTPLQTVYDLFQSKVDDDFTGKDLLIFQWFNSAIPKCKKYTSVTLDYTLNLGSQTDGFFNNILLDDDVELLALQMKYEYYDKKNAYLIGLQRELGTKDFNSLPDKKRELDGLQNSMKLLKEDIRELRQEMNSYNYS